MAISCGIDFGTSNSSVAIAQHDQVILVPVEKTHITIPSAIFIPPQGYNPIYGRAAVKMFFDRQEGRFMRSLKRVLGTPLMKHGTQVNGKPLKFEKIIASFIQNLKERANILAKEEIENVVMGRPVHFVDNDKDADHRAQEELTSIAQRIGYKHVEFQFEPIAAAFAHEVNIKGEKLAIVADLGGGTSDFTVIRLSSQYAAKADRAEDILANTGVRVGGNDFDKDLALSSIMPELGYLSTYGKKNLEVPLKYYHDLAEWSKVNLLYSPKVLSQVRQFFHESHDKRRFGRLLKLLEQERGHSLLSTAEDTKIALTTRADHTASFDFLEKDFAIPISRKQFEDAIQHEVGKISKAATECLLKSGIKADKIDLVILTGGSTEVPLVQLAFKKLFPQAAVADENKLSSVGIGLAYDSRKKFR
ncbi:Hsp70 family protein [Chryseolinea sp. H1M3-3]|uniref:Hsp70 family protein n=1 Tax=Chryseolinea sp. H1M3-3 TaxID=3034144 RepID=UPI0023ED76E6|nr:Hsp70 family protein [Chryseolinea sp. H1M3-3]